MYKEGIIQAGGKASRVWMEAYDDAAAGGRELDQSRCGIQSIILHGSWVEFWKIIGSSQIREPNSQMSCLLFHSRLDIRR